MTVFRQSDRPEISCESTQVSFACARATSCGNSLPRSHYVHGLFQRDGEIACANWAGTTMFKSIFPHFGQTLASTGNSTQSSPAERARNSIFVCKSIRSTSQPSHLMERYLL